jgi:hypothetical protein
MRRMAGMEPLTLAAAIAPEHLFPEGGARELLAPLPAAAVHSLQEPRAGAREAQELKPGPFRHTP